MKELTFRPGPLALALIALALVLAMEMVLAGRAGAGPYPRHDHYGISEDKRQYSKFRRDDYLDYEIHRFYRKDQYKDHLRPTLSTLDPTPEGSISLDRVETKRSQYDLFKDYHLKSHKGEGWYDKAGEKKYGKEYGEDWWGRDSYKSPITKK